MSSKTKEIGTIGELQFASEAMKCGFNVFREVGDNSDVDLILLKNNKVIKVQVKSTQSIHSDGTMRWVISKSRQNHNENRKEFYDDGIDGFGVYCVENNYVGFVPKDACTSKYHLWLRIDQPKNNQNKNIKFAKDFILENLII